MLLLRAILSIYSGKFTTNLLAKLKKYARFYFGNDMFASKSNEVESRYLPEKDTSLEVESSV